jgi:hypothetical protein
MRTSRCEHSNKPMRASRGDHAEVLMFPACYCRGQETLVKRVRTLHPEKKGKAPTVRWCTVHRAPLLCHVAELTPVTVYIAAVRHRHWHEANMSRCPCIFEYSP